MQRTVLSLVFLGLAACGPSPKNAVPVTPEPPLPVVVAPAPEAAPVPEPDPDTESDEGKVWYRVKFDRPAGWIAFQEGEDADILLLDPQTGSKGVVTLFADPDASAEGYIDVAIAQARSEIPVTEGTVVTEAVADGPNDERRRFIYDNVKIDNQFWTGIVVAVPTPNPRVVVIASVMWPTMMTKFMAETAENLFVGLTVVITESPAQSAPDTPE